VVAFVAPPAPAAAGLATTEEVSEPQLEALAQDAPVPAEPPAPVALVAEPGAAAPERALPRRGRIVYDVLYGDGRFPVGQVVQSWEVKDDEYTLASEAETSGIVDLFRPQRLRYMSQGRVLPGGLRPDSFLVSRTRNGRSEASQARFDWRAREIAYGPAPSQKRVALPEGAHDLMSFIYQFALAPRPPGRYRLPIATGSRFEVYDVEVAPEKRIETPLGTLTALSVRQVPRPGAESIEFALAAEYRYLPVRIRHYDREGRFSGEQVVSEIRVSED
jgi:hypothetical protein